MEPEEQVEDTIRQLEEFLLAAEVRCSPQQVASLLSEDFVEYGSSGKVYGRQQTIDGLSRAPAVPMTIDEFRVRILAADIVLVTYRLVKHESQPRHSLRCSIWQRENGRWRITFHQGTPTEGSR